MQKLIEYFKKIINFIRYILFGKDLKSDILFLAVLFGLYFIMQLTYPYFISVVMSPSMQHDHFSIDKYKKYNISLNEIKKWPFPNGINVGDVVIILPVHSPKDIKEGDVILYKGIDGRPIMHRVIKIVNTTHGICYIIMGDNNPAPIGYQGENCMPYNRILGKVVFRIPYLGLPKVLLVKLLEKIID